MGEPAPPPPTLGDDLCLEDVQRVVAGALATCRPLLTAGERVMAERILALQGPPGRLWARLAGRQGEVFRVDQLSYAGVPDPDGALDALIALDLAHEGLPASLRVLVFTVPELKEICAALGLPRGGRRVELVERVAAQPGWRRGRVFRVACKGLLRRLERTWFRHPWRDRTAMILERLGQVRWVDYTPTGGGRPFRDRDELRAFEASLAPWEGEPAEALARMRAQRRRPPHLRSLDARRRWARRVREGARALERAGQAAEALALYEALLAEGPYHPGEVVRRLSLAAEAAGVPARGVEVCAAWVTHVSPGAVPGVERTGRRLARKLGLPWRPQPPLKSPSSRTLSMTRVAGEANRPAWGPAGLTVEAAVVEHLRPRAAIHGENATWTTFFGLLFGDLYWLPVPGMLPTPYLDGPMDLGTADFAAHRPDEVRSRLEELREGGGPARLAENLARFEGLRLAGVAPSLADRDTLVAIAEGLGGPGLAAIMARLAVEGWSAARGLPDLVLPPGPAVELADAFPGRVGEGVLLVEVKGQGDSLRDEQRVWLDRLVRAGVPVEVWKVEART
ncbi:MAG: VRR-NUC domain-containing protein [Alphaproteobacteria bacterium]|nr:VRR-NUC domain-containing protein [Alphaproteobacteria bacterium]